MHLKNFRKAVFALSGAVAISFLTLTGTFAAEDNSHVYKLADIDTVVTLPEDMHGFTRSSSANDPYLDLIQVEDVEALTAQMLRTRTYLEAVPTNDDKVNYEILVSERTAPANVTDMNTMSDSDLSDMFIQYQEQTKTTLESSKETQEVLDFSEYKTNAGDRFFVTDMKSTNDKGVTVYVKNYYTIRRSHAILFSIQSNEKEIDEALQTRMEGILNNVRFEEVKENLLNTPLFSTIINVLITGGLPVLILVIILFVLKKSTKRHKN